MKLQDCFYWRQLHCDFQGVMYWITKTLHGIKKLLSVISNSVPFKPNMNVLSERTGISLNTMKNYLKLLNDAQILQLLYVEEKGINRYINSWLIVIGYWYSESPSSFSPLGESRDEVVCVGQLGGWLYSNAKSLCVLFTVHLGRGRGVG